MHSPLSASKRAVRLIHADSRILFKEMALVVGWSERKLRDWANEIDGTGDIGDKAIVRLSHYLLNMGENRFTLSLLTPEFSLRRKDSVTSNGSLDDESADLLRVTGEVLRVFDNRAPEPEQQKAINDLRNVVDRVEAELDRI